MLSRGNEFFFNGKLKEALECYSRVLETNPRHGAASLNRGTVLYQLGHVEASLPEYSAAIQNGEATSLAYINRGNAFYLLERYEEAILDYDKAREIDPGNVLLRARRGQTLARLGRFEEALPEIAKYLESNAGDAVGFNELAIIYRGLGRDSDALAALEKSISIAPSFEHSYLNCGALFIAIGRFEDAVACYDKAIELNPSNEHAYNNKGIALNAINRKHEAIEWYDRAIELNPHRADFYQNKGKSLGDLRKRKEALACFAKAVEIDPDYMEAHAGHADQLLHLDHQDEALVSYGRAVEINPDYPFLLGHLNFQEMRLCKWNGFEDRVNQIKSGVMAGRQITKPFPFLLLADDPEMQLRAARTCAKAEYPDKADPLLFKGHGQSPSGKIRIGYFSADFSSHATIYLFNDVLHLHDRSNYEIYGFAFGPDVDVKIRQKLEPLFDRFIDVDELSDRDVAKLSREIGIDIAVDMKGYTADARLGIFAEGAAPIQVSYLGYPGTLGADYIHYVIADKVVMPPENIAYFTEKAVFLPNSYQPNEAARRMSEPKATKEDLGLPETGFVFCSFNAPFKHNPQWFSGWMRILGAVEGSVLWLLGGPPSLENNLRREAEARGVDGARIVFAKRVPVGDHLARHRYADLSLDNLPCNAHTTASDSIRAGVPILTCQGRSFAGRVASSLLNAIGVPELITFSQDEYESLAVELATNPGKLKSLREKIEQNSQTAPLFDSKRYTRHLELAYMAMHERYRAGLPPDHIEIPN